MTDILTLPEARAALRLPANDVSNDADLTAYYIPAITPVVEDVAGPILLASKTVTQDGGKSQVLLPSAPVVSVDQVVETGIVLNAGTDYVANLRSGIVTRGTQLFPFLFLPGVANVTVNYTVGSNTIPKNVILAARIILRQLWDNDQQGARPAFGAPDNDTVQTPSGYLIPKRAYQLLNPTRPAPGFA